MFDLHMKMHNIHMKDFYERIPLGKKMIDGRFVIPSGVRCASPKVIERYFEAESVGIITTKSISIHPKEGYKEPIFVKYGEQSYINAVGLANPGAIAFKEELKKITVPENKFLLVSVFGKDESEFLAAAKELEDYADGFELNMSCPHSSGYGLQVGNDSELVGRITKAMASSFDVPIFVKLSATMPKILETAVIALENGATGITATNTLGPSMEYISEMPVLFNREGGMSGSAIRPMGLKAVMDLRRTIGNDPIIIGLGGIFGKNDVDSYNMAGADFFGIGSALTGLTTEQAIEFLDTMRWDLIRNREKDTFERPAVNNMDYYKCIIESKQKIKEDLYKISVSPWRNYQQCKNTAGKFYFIMIGEMGEKPFALLSYEKREFVIRKIGPFTKELCKLKVGDTVFIRGPYGKDIPDYHGKIINLIGGGTGISPTYEIAKKYSKDNKIRFFFGGKEQEDIFELQRFEQLGEVIVATEDGSIGVKGTVLNALEEYQFTDEEELVFINVGPRAMIESVYQYEKKHADKDNIWISIEYQTSCGVGICGKCATEEGKLSCVDGPFMRRYDLS